MYEKYIQMAEERLNAAKYLFEGGFYNDAVSRAYYSMFYAAKALLALKNLYPKAHKGVVSKFGLEFVKEGFIEDIYGRAFVHAKDRRESAEYDIEKRIDEEEAESIIDDADRFLERMKRAINEFKSSGRVS